MAATQAAAGCVARVALTTRTEGGTIPAARTQIICSSKLRFVPIQTSNSVSSLRGSSVERILSRRFKVAVDNVYMNSSTKVEAFHTVEEDKDSKSPEIRPPKAAPGAPVSAFMANVSNLIKLVDSRDIVELELKFKDYEIVIRKMEALPLASQATIPGLHVMAHTPFPGYVPLPVPTPTLAPAPALPRDPVPPPSKPPHPPMLSPMAGTFYRSAAPSEAAFVQVGDKVEKGQVVCIVEAMKLMNEIEVDRSGTIVEIFAEDGKPVSIESPLFSIKP